VPAARRQKATAGQGREGNAQDESFFDA
jgi:hypothetical protein